MNRYSNVLRIARFMVLPLVLLHAIFLNGCIGLALRQVDVSSEPPGAGVFVKFTDKDIPYYAGSTPCKSPATPESKIAVRWPDMTCSDWKPLDDYKPMDFKKDEYPQGKNRISPFNILNYAEIKPSENSVGLSLQVDELAIHSRKEKPDEIGNLTFSVAALPAGKVYTAVPLPTALHNYVSDTLERAGYSVVDMRGQTKADAPVLMGEIKNFWFGVYTWFMPVYYSGGTIEYRMFLQTPDGKLLWEKTIKTSGSSMTPMVSLAIADALTKMLNEVMVTVQSKPFLEALQQTNGR